MGNLRIVSLLPSATEILFALGLGNEVVGLSHECDYPAAARSKPVVVQTRIPKNTPSSEVDRLVRQLSERGESIYKVDGEALRRLSPDLIITQDLCQVCAPSPDDLAAILASFDERPSVLSLDPLDLGDVWRDILRVGEKTMHPHAAERLLESIGQNLATIESEVARAVCRPRVAFLEWLQPPYVGGHWIPEMVELAGGVDLFGKVRKPSFRINLEELVAAQPEILVVAPCGYTAEQARTECASITFPREWQEMPAVRNNQIYYINANAYFSRPGPRLVTGLEILAKLFHPGVKEGTCSACDRPSAYNLLLKTKS